MKRRIIICLLVLFFVIHFIYAIEIKQEYSYHLQKLEYYNDVVTSGENKQFKVVIFSDNTKYILLHELGYSDFNTYITITRDGNTWMPNNMYFLGEDLLIDVSGIGLAKGQYLLGITNNGIGDVFVSLDVDGVLNNTQVIGFVWKKLFYFCTLIILFIIGSIVVVFRKTKDMPRAFFISTVILGVLLVFMIPPYTAPDELRHFCRVYDISQGNVACKKFVEREEYGSIFPVCYLPKEYYDLKEISENSSETYSSEVNRKIAFDVLKDKLFQEESGTIREAAIIGSYAISFLAYIPQIIGVWLAKFLGLSPIFVIYMARIANLISSTLIASIGLKIIPGYKGSYIAVYYSPYISFMRSTNSTDGLLISLVLLFVAIVLRGKERGEISKKERIELLIICLGISVIKLPYILIAISLLIMSIDDKRVKKQLYYSKKDIFWCCGIIIVALVFYKLNNLITMRYEIDTISTSDGIIAHVLFIILHPIRFLSIFGTEYIAKLPFYLDGAFSFPDASNYTIPSLLLLIWVAVGCQRKRILSKKEKNLLLFLAAFIWMSIVAVFYLLGPSDVGEIWGIQGRYLHPLMFLVLLGLNYENNIDEVSAIRVIDYSMIILLGYIYSMVEHFWL